MKPVFDHLAMLHLRAAIRLKHRWVDASLAMVGGAAVTAPFSPEVALFWMLPCGALFARFALAAARRVDSLLARAVAADLIEVEPEKLAEAA